MADEQNNTGNNNATADAQGNANAGGTGNSNGAAGNTGLTQADIQKALDAQHLRHLKEKSVLEAQIADLKKASKGDDDTKGEDLTALKDRLAAMEQREKVSKDREQKAHLLTVAAELNAVNGEQVAMLVSPFIKGEGDHFSVVNAEGQARFNGEGKPMSVRELVSEFLTNNPHHVRAAGNSGAGSHGARFENGASNSALLKLSPVERLKAARRAGIK